MELIYQLNNTMENSAFRKIMSLVTEAGDFEQTLPSLQYNFMIKLYKIIDLKSAAVEQLYLSLQKKFYVKRKDRQEFWYENELRIFIWLLFAYLHVYKKSINQLNDEDWHFFSQIFKSKSTIFFEFQAMSIIKSKQRLHAWAEEETLLLQTIIQQSGLKNRWNSIAREFFLRSGKRFFRNPKQCRERWMNYLDPIKIHSEWTPAEDLTLLTTIRKKGKRWSLAVRELNNTRTQHMVKNRYKSLISNQAKKYPEKKEAELEALLIKRLSKAQDRLRADSLKIEEKEEVLDIGRPEELENMTQDKLLIKQEKRQTDVKMEKQALLVQNFHLLDEELNLNSPIFITWKTQRRHRMDLSEQEGIYMGSHCYEYQQSQQMGFLRF